MPYFHPISFPTPSFHPTTSITITDRRHSHIIPQTDLRIEVTPRSHDDGHRQHLTERSPPDIARLCGRKPTDERDHPTVCAGLH